MTFSPFPRPLGRPRRWNDLRGTPARRRAGGRASPAALALLLALLPAEVAAQTQRPATPPGGEAVAVATPGTAPASGAAGATWLPASPTADRSALAPPGDLKDLGLWLAYRRDSHRSALPDEARLFYRRGLLARHTGDAQEATRLVRGAAELDPSFVAPHLTLAAWALPRDPSQALLRYAVVLDLVRRSFLLQVELVANLLFLALHALALALLIASLFVILARQAELRHIWQERLARRLNPASARAWTWVILVVPFVAGLGLALPAVAFLGMLWPLLRPRERMLQTGLVLAMVAAPFAGHLFGRLAVPLREERAPLYGVTRLPGEAWSPSAQARFARLAAEQPGNPFAHFGLAWLARQGDDLPTAEEAYRRALSLWPQDARVMNNLANVMVARGQPAPAMELYRAAMAADPGNAAAPFNLSQVYTRQYDYGAASEAAARASALDFELVKNQQALGTEDGALPLADEWLPPAAFWRTLLDPQAVPRPEPVLPPLWQGRIETSGPLFSALALLLAFGSVLLGVRWQRAVPLRLCGNCGRVVCRRCARRRRELALCQACARQESSAESQDFARVLLARARHRCERSRAVMRTILAVLLPGYGLIAFHRVFRATLVLAALLFLAAPWLGVTAPFSYHAWPGMGEAGIPAPVALLPWVTFYLGSLLGYFSQARRAAAQAAALAAPVRSRPSATGRITAKAA